MPRAKRTTRTKRAKNGDEPRGKYFRLSSVTMTQYRQWCKKHPAIQEGCLVDALLVWAMAHPAVIAEILGLIQPVSGERATPAEVARRAAGLDRELGEHVAGQPRQKPPGRTASSG